MPHFRATITVMLRSSILDVQGKTVEHALHALGFTAVENVRIGKHITLELYAESHDAAIEQCHQMSQQLLANTIIEDYSIIVEPSQQ
ncbi:MAG: phosphoribosylformylglycinamidine synthase subunit PurS [Chlorobi bacterium]|nr:phosphoribosylformylglycinamidine synthase subunit PurS [Chlorobiota bacterium]